MTDDALLQARDRLQTIFDTMHPGELTDDERHRIAQEAWFGVEEANAALGEPSWFDSPAWSGKTPAAMTGAADRLEGALG